MVKRFEYLEDLHHIVEDEEGKYVLYEDYKAREKELLDLINSHPSIFVENIW